MKWTRYIYLFTRLEMLCFFSSFNFEGIQNVISYHATIGCGGTSFIYLLFRYQIFTEKQRGFRYFNSRFVIAATVAAVVFILDVFCVYHSNDLFTFIVNLRGF